MANKRVQILASLDVLKRSHSTNESKVVALGGQFGELEARLALLRVRGFEAIRATLTDIQHITLQQAAQ
jgi:hypothetical protein